MSAYVAYDITAVDRDGNVIGRRSVRAVCMPTRDESLELAREQYGDDVTGTTTVRSIPSRIGIRTPAARRTVSARAKVMTS